LTQSVKFSLVIDVLVIIHVVINMIGTL